MTNIKMSTITFGGEEIFNITDEKSVHFNKAQTLTEEEKKQARTNIGAVSAEEVGKLSEDIAAINNEKVSYQTIKSSNLIDESKIYYRKWWTQNGLEESQYTKNYFACEVNVTGLQKITISYFKEDSINNPLFRSYFEVYENGTLNEVIIGDYVPTHTIEIKNNVNSIRFNLNSQSTAWNLMVNEGEIALPYEPYFEEKTIIPGVTEEIEKIKNTLNPRIVLSDKLFAIVGDTIQVFFKNLIDGDIGNLHIMFECAKGKNFPRYWEYTPTESDVGSYPITIKLLNNVGDVITEKTSSLIITNASNPSSTVNVLCIGDSTMENGQIPIEASRRIKGTTGTAIKPTAMALSNINFVGRKTNADGSVGWEGNGGWTYESYNISGYTAIRYAVTDATNLNIGAVYQIGSFKFTISEINVTNGIGNVRCLFYFTTPYSSSWDGTAQSGTLALFSGEGQSSITFSGWVKETYQPFWDAESNTWDILNYRDVYCNGQIDEICILLGINSLINKTPFTDISVEGAKTLLRNIHSQLPNCKIVISTLPLVSPNGGIAANYGASSETGAYSASVKNLMVADFNLALIELAESAEFESYVTVSNTHAQFDIEHGYPTITKAVNTRSTETEILQSNGVHPNDVGYWQLSDALTFRSCLSVIMAK